MEWTKEREKEYKREWRKKNAEKAQGYQRKYREKNIDTLRTKAREYRRDNKEEINAKVNQSRRDLKAKAIAHLGGVCVDCGGTYHQAAYDFHHEKGKDFGIGGLFLKDWPKVERELQKCVLLCSNCHRVRHFDD